ncbi:MULTISPECIES: hypothetical protein [unclassified Wolbachia]|nr:MULTISPECIES: hypothetical protein [unclassified Wolbachia]
MTEADTPLCHSSASFSCHPSAFFLSSQCPDYLDPGKRMVSSK